MSSTVSPSVFISWAHSGPNWEEEQSNAWRGLVGSFAHTLVDGGGINADIDLWHDTEPLDWTRWGPQQVEDSDRVIIVASQAWADRFAGRNDPTKGAGAAAEADTLHGLFNSNQASFQQKTLLVLLPGVEESEIPARLHRVNRFRISDISSAGIEPLVRYLTGQPKYMRPAVGSVPVLPATSFETPLSKSVEHGASRRLSEHATTAEAGENNATSRDGISIVGNGNILQIGAQNTNNAVSPSALDLDTRQGYLSSLSAASDSRLRYRRRGAGLNEDQVERSLTLRASIPTKIDIFPAGELRVLTGPLGAGKSDIAEEWHQSCVDNAKRDGHAAIPLWFSIDDLDIPLERAIISEIGRSVLATVGVDLVVDGLDERTDRAANAVRQATDLIAKYRRSRILLTSRTDVGVPRDSVVEAPPLSRGETMMLVRAVAPRADIPVGKQLGEAFLGRPFFALLVAQYASNTDGLTGVPELIDLVVGRIVEASAYDMYDDLKRLAVETTRTGRAVDPSMFTTSAVAAQLKRSPLLVPSSGRSCSFSLATFEQWFASKALLEGDVDIDDLLSTLDSFDRWKYVFAIVLAAGHPHRVDPIMGRLAAWNPGAAAWVVRETRRGGLRRALPETHPEDWKDIGMRLRVATGAWLNGLGQLSSAFSMYRLGGVRALDDATVAVEVDGHRLSVTWMTSEGAAGDSLPPVVQRMPVGPDGLPDRAMVMRGADALTGLNWVWEKTQADLANDLDGAFESIATTLGASQPGVMADEIREERNGQTWFGGLQPHPFDPPARQAVPLYPGPDRPATAHHPWGRYSVEQMHKRAEAILAAAMESYLELVEILLPTFGNTLPHRGLMPVEYYANMIYEPDKARSAFDFPGQQDPGIHWVLKPLGQDSKSARPSNRVSLAINDSKRSDDIGDDRDVLYREYRRYLEANPTYEPFAGNFRTVSGSLSVHKPSPASSIALQWISEDLQQLGFLTKKYR